MPSLHWNRRDLLKTLIATAGGVFLPNIAQPNAVAPSLPNGRGDEVESLLNSSTSLSASLESPIAAVMNVMAYGAVGDGVTDDSAAIAAAIAAVGAGGSILLPAGKTFFITRGLSVEVDRLTILGHGATLDSSALNGIALSVSGKSFTVDGLRFVGPPLETTLTTTILTRARAIHLEGSPNAHVTNCRFEGYSRGGIKVMTSNCNITGNHFEGVRYFDTDHLGAIYVTGSDNTIIGNVLQEVWDTGIHVRGGARNTVTGNTVVCSTHENATNSMGLRINAGGQNNTFSANVVHHAQQEGITLAASAEKETTGNVITSNILLDGGYAGIALASRGGLVNRNIIANNSIHAGVRSLSHGILINTRVGKEAMHNIVQGNMIAGVDVAGVSQLERGISQFGPGTHYNQIIGNRVVNAENTGISCLGNNTLVSGNYLEACNIGISAAGCIGSLITDNIVRTSGIASIFIRSNVDQLIVASNTLDREWTLDNPRGTYLIERNNIEGIAITS